MRRRRILGVGLAAAAVALVAASTAYACVVIKGNGRVTGSVRASNLMTGFPAGHANYCPANGRQPITAAAGPPGSRLTATFAPADRCNDDGQNKLSDGTYDVRLRNALAWTGADGTGWVQVAGSGCFAPQNVNQPNNFDLGDMPVSGGSGSFSGAVPTGATLTNGPNDASIFCVGKKDGADGQATGASDGFLAPFRVATV